jgi:NitT/TauT family transport system substrate-binding protein
MQRRSIFAAVVALAAAVAAPLAQAQQTLTPVSLRLNWYLGGLHVPFYYGKERGFYKDEGIDLTINEGRGSANTVQVVAAGSDTFGLADSSSVITTAAKGAEIKSVMSSRSRKPASRPRRTSRASASRSRPATPCARCWKRCAR